jgi:hypothetical protein
MLPDVVKAYVQVLVLVAPALLPVIHHRSRLPSRGRQEPVEFYSLACLAALNTPLEPPAFLPNVTYNLFDTTVRSMSAGRKRLVFSTLTLAIMFQFSLGFQPCILIQDLDLPYFNSK